MIDLNKNNNQNDEPREEPQGSCLKLEQISADLNTGNNRFDQQAAKKNKKTKTKLTAKVIKKKSHHFFSADSKPSNFDNMRMEEIMEDDIMFRYRYFFEFLVYHVLFYIFLGPLAIPVVWLVAGKSAVYNQLFLAKRICMLLAWQYLLFLTNFSALFLFYFYKEEIDNIYWVELYMALASCFLRLCIICSKYGTFSPEKIAFIKHKIMEIDENQSEWTFISWRKQLDSVIDAELKNTLARLNIDPSFLYFKFFGDNEVNNFLDLKESESDTKIERSSFLKSKRLRDSLSSPEDFDHFIIAFPLNSFTLPSSPVRLEKEPVQINMKEMLSGIKLARSILSKVRTLQWNFTSISVLGTALAILHALIPSFYRYRERGSFLGTNNYEMLLSILFISINSWYFTANLHFMLYGIVDFRRLRNLLSQLSNLISTSAVTNYRTKKFFPTLNFYCPISLRAWGTLHRIFRDYGKKYRVRLEMNNKVHLLFYIILLILCVLSIFKVVDYIDTVSMIVFAFEVFIVVIICLLMIYEGAVINSFYDIHAASLKKVKDILQDLHLFVEVYFDELKPFATQNEIFSEGIKTIFANAKQEITPKKRRAKVNLTLTKLMRVCDNFHEELLMGQRLSPFKLFGIRASMRLLQSIIAAISSVVLVGLQYLARR